MTFLIAVSGDDDVAGLMDVGKELADGLETELTVVHVASTDDFEAYRDELENVPGMSEYSIDQREDSAARTAERLVEAMVSEDEIPEDISYIGKVGDPASEVVSAVNEIDARYLVIGGRKRSPTGKAVFGSVTQSILLNTEVPTVTVMK